MTKRKNPIETAITVVIFVLAIIGGLVIQPKIHQLFNQGGTTMQRKFTMAFHILGQLGANASIKFTVPSDCTLKHVSAVQSDADAAGIEIGTSADADGYIKKYSCGVSGTPVEKEALTDFDGALADSQYPHISDGTIVAIAIDYDYNAGAGSGAASDITLVLTFVEG